MTSPDATTNAMIKLAARIADEVFFPAAGVIDRADRVPASHFDLLASEGFYAMAAPTSIGGLGTENYPAWTTIVETLASGCLATTFVWIQHIGPMLATGAPSLATGEQRAGIAYAGLAPGSDLVLRDGRLSGHIPWVTGWDMIDVVQVAVRDGDLVRYFLLDAVAGPTLHASVQDLVAVRASRTASLVFDEHPAPAGRLVKTEDHAAWAEQNASGAALNGYLALGLVRRASLLLGGAFDDELARCRLLLGDLRQTPRARAEASALAWRAAGAVMVQAGSSGVRSAETAARLVREAAFLLVFGSRPAIKTELNRLLGPF